MNVNKSLIRGKEACRKCQRNDFLSVSDLDAWNSGVKGYVCQNKNIQMFFKSKI